MVMNVALALAATGYALQGPLPRSAGRSAVVRMTSGGGDLESWLLNEAGVSPKFIGQVLSTCEEEMIGSVANMQTLSNAGMLTSLFKPVIAASIEGALSGAVAGAPVSVAPARLG